MLAGRGICISSLHSLCLSSFSLARSHPFCLISCALSSHFSILSFSHTSMADSRKMQHGGGKGGEFSRSKGGGEVLGSGGGSKCPTYGMEGEGRGGSSILPSHMFI